MDTQEVATKSQEGRDPHTLLGSADGDEKVRILLRLIEEHPEGRLDLSATSRKVPLNEIDLSAANLGSMVEKEAPVPEWWLPNVERVNLRLANLQGASLRSAKLRGILMEEANFSGADLSGADLQQASLGQINLEGALLEEAVLCGAGLRYARMKGAVLESADLQGADLWGADLQDAVLEHAALQGARLGEANLCGANLAGADLRGAVLGKTNLESANLTGADLRDTVLRNVNLRGAILKDAKLQGVMLTHCDIAHVYLSEALFEKTRMYREQLGDAIGEELVRDYSAARQGYLALEQNFNSLGDHDAASWSYLKRRRMQKLAFRAEALGAMRARHVGKGLSLYAKYLIDQLVEWLCDYGESMLRVFRAMVLTFLVFTVLYGLSGDVVQVQTTASGAEMETDPSWLSLATFSLVSMTTAGTPDVGLTVRDNFIHVLTGLQGAMGIGLLGLFAFVLGNRIRR